MIGVTSGMVQSPQTPPALFDRALLQSRQRRAQTQGEVTFLLDRVAEDMSDRLAAVMREFHAAVDLWTPGEGLAALRTRLPSLQRIALDAAGSETLPFAPESLDLVVSALALQFVNDLPGVLAQIRRALKPDGLLLAAMIGGDSLTELRQAFA
ncbi:methyltransferase domain-containing protein, partial [Bradyrhizobium ottawaense]